MFRKLNKNRKGQNTAEYALLISLVVAAIIAMQTYAQRTLQARIRDAAQYLTKQTNIEGMGGTSQYEPYYLQSNYQVDRKSSEIMIQDNAFVGMNEVTNRVRASGGFQESAYNGINGE